MSFWLDRFRRDDEEDIWEELKEMLKNSDKYEAEKKLQEARELEAFNKAWDKANGVETDAISQGKSYLKNENLLDNPKQTIDRLVGFATTQSPLEGFGQSVFNGLNKKKNENTFPDLGKASDFRKEGFAPIYENDTKRYLVDPNQRPISDKKRRKDLEENDYPIEADVDEEVDNASTSSIEQENTKVNDSDAQNKTVEEPYLKYEDLLPDETDEERQTREAQELEAFNKAWDKANGVDTDAISQGKSYLKKEKLLDKPKTLIGEPTGMATPMYEGSVAYEKHLTPYEQIDAKRDWSDELKAQKKAEVAKIQEAARTRENEINREYILEQAKNYGGAALEIGSAAVPGYGGTKLAGTLAKKLAPKLGRKIASEIATGTLKGASSGTVAGLGESLLEKESLTSTLPRNIAQNIASNTILNSTGGLINKLNIEKKLNNFKETPKTNPRQYRKMQDLKRQYYDDYISGTSAQKKYTKNSFEVKSKDLLNYSNNIKPLSNGDEYLEEMRRRRRRGW